MPELVIKRAQIHQERLDKQLKALAVSGAKIAGITGRRGVYSIVLKDDLSTAELVEVQAAIAAHDPDAKLQEEIDEETRINKLATLKAAADAVDVRVLTPADTQKLLEYLLDKIADLEKRIAILE